MEELFTTLAAAGIAAQRPLPGVGLHRRQRAQPHRAAALHARRRLRAPRRHCAGLHRHARSRTISTPTSSAASPAPTRSSATSTAPPHPPASCSRPNGLPLHQATPQVALLHLHHPACGAGQRRRHRRAGAGVDLRPRPARLERRGQRRQRPGHGQRAQLRLLRHQVDRHVGRGRLQRLRHPAEPLELPQPDRSPATVDDRPALPRPADDPSAGLRLRSGLPGLHRATR